MSKRSQRTRHSALANTSDAEGDNSSTAESLTSEDGTRKGKTGRRVNSAAKSLASSTLSSPIDREEEGETWDEELKHIIECGLIEKSATYRESSLSKIIRLLSQHVAAHVLENHRVSFYESLKRSIRRGDAKESALASRALSLLFFTLGADEEKNFDDISPVLKTVASTSTFAAAKAEAVRALGTVSFITNSLAPKEIEGILSFLDTVLFSKETVPEVTLAALDAYGLLYTILGDLDLEREAFDRTMPAHLKLLQSTNGDVRIAAGENIALMYESLAQQGRVRYDNQNKLLEILSTLATETAKHKSKKDRTIQKAAFRDIVHAIAEGRSTSTKLQFKSEVVHIEGFGRIKQLNVFRELLGEGFQVQFLENPLLQEIFDVSFYGSGKKHIPPGSTGRSRTVGIKADRFSKDRHGSIWEGEETL